MRDYLVIYVNGFRQVIRGDAVFQPLSTWLRESLGLYGTKVVCAEGDCGSCSVLIGRPGAANLDYQTACSCIQYLFQLDATHVVTIEGLATQQGLNPIQSAMVRHHGAQCGFCTPGFIVAMYAMLDDHRAVSAEGMRRGLVGNLCRCTGYDPILRAGLSVDPASVTPLNALHHSAARIDELTRAESEPVRIETQGRLAYKPTSLADAVAFLAAYPQCTLIAGGTDLCVQANKGQRKFEVVLSTRALSELRSLHADDNALHVGSSVTLAELEEVCLRVLPEYGRMLARFGSPPIRHAATLGGNIANGSPIGDSMPALFVLNAEIELLGSNGARWVNMNDFYTGYRRTVMTRSELLTRVRVPLPRAGEAFRVYKVSRRRDLDISAFTAAFWLRTSGDRIDEIRIAFGGVAPVIRRLTRTEDLLRGASPSREVIQVAAKSARDEVAPISDVRGSADYRRQLSENILWKFFCDISPGDSKLRDQGHSPSNSRK